MLKFRNGLLIAAMMLAPGLAAAQVPGMTFPADPYTASSPLSREIGRAHV